MEIERKWTMMSCSWKAEDYGMGTYLSEECTGKPGSSMGEYWVQTRGCYIGFEITVPNKRTIEVSQETCPHEF